MTQSGSDPRFFADAMLGRLAKRLRLAGFDTLYERSIADADLVTRARAEGRIIVTRDRRLAQRRLARDAVVLVADRVDAQWREITLRMPDLLHGDALSRCAECNGVLVELPTEEARPLVPPYVAQTQRVFSRCPACGRVYWAGTHVERIRRALETK